MKSYLFLSGLVIVRYKKYDRCIIKALIGWTRGKFGRSTKFKLNKIVRSKDITVEPRFDLCILHEELSDEVALFFCSFLLFEVKISLCLSSLAAAFWTPLTDLSSILVFSYIKNPSRQRPFSSILIRLEILHELSGNFSKNQIRS